MIHPTDSVFPQIIHLLVGDKLELRTDPRNTFTGELYRLTFCVSLTGFDY